jgi:hypothetical protein
MIMKPILLVSLISLGVGLQSSSVLGFELSEESRKAIRRLHKTFIENSEKQIRFCVFGSMEVMNLDRDLANAPASLSSEFILLADLSKKYRRHSCAKESLNAGKQVSLGWYSRVQNDGRITGGFEKGGPLKEVNAVHNLVYDNDPWYVAIAAASHISDEQAVAGFFDRICDISKAIDFRELNGDKTVLYQYNETCRVQVLYSQKHGSMPVQTQWLVARSTINPKAEPGDYFVHNQILTRWAEYSGTWLPYRIGVECYQPTGNSKQLLTDDWTFEYHWVSNKAIDIDKLNQLTSLELLEYAQAYEVKPNPRKLRR